MLGMAGNFALNTAAIPTLTQVLVAFHDGTIYDYKAQQSGGVVVLADPKKQAAVRAIKIGGVPVHTET